jgi:hypothetical protein
MMGMAWHEIYGTAMARLDFDKRDIHDGNGMEPALATATVDRRVGKDRAAKRVFVVFLYFQHVELSYNCKSLDSENGGSRAHR